MRQPTAQESDGIVSKPSPVPVGDTVTRLRRLLEEKDLTLFAVIDHSGEATKVGLDMPDTKLVIFGSPAAGTPVMVAAPLAALDLPLKVLVWADTDGTAWVSYNTAGYLASRHHLSEELRSRLDAIETITNDLVTENR